MGSVLGLFLGKLWVCFRSVISNFRSVFFSSFNWKLWLGKIDFLSEDVGVSGGDSGKMGW